MHDTKLIYIASSRANQKDRALNSGELSLAGVCWPSDKSTRIKQPRTVCQQKHYIVLPCSMSRNSPVECCAQVRRTTPWGVRNLRCTYKLRKSLTYVIFTYILLSVWGQLIFFSYFHLLCLVWHVVKRYWWELYTVRRWASNSQYWWSCGTLNF